MTFVEPYDIPTSEIDLEYPCSECEFYKGGDDSCLDCPVMVRYLILIGESSPAQYCPECDWVIPKDRFYELQFFCPSCKGTVLEYVQWYVQ